MSFQTRQIRRRPRKKPFKKIKKIVASAIRVASKASPKKKSYIVGAILVIFAIFVVGKVMLVAYNFVSNFDAKSLISVAGSDLEKDDYGYTNILLLGDGGHVRDGADLIDTIMVASIDHKKNAVSLLSIPRDFYVTPSIGRPGKVNEVYRNNHKNIGEEEAYELFQDVAGDVAGLDIHYHLRVDFNAFVEVVDSLGGIMVNVENAINDPYYPNETDNGYKTFRIDKGPQVMDGEIALKFVRSRKTTSDFDRASRQQQVIQAIREKALSKKVLTSPKKLKSLYEAVDNNINTNMSLREMISLAGFGKEMNRDHVVAKVLHDDPGQDGGFLYTPERKYYNGQFVLVPFGDDFELIHKYANLIFHQREAFYSPAKIEILNATETPGIARKAAYQLNRFGFDIVNLDNYKGDDGENEYLGKSRIVYNDWDEDKNGKVSPKRSATLNALRGYVKGDISQGDKAYAEQGIDISIILGEDYDVFLVK